MEFAAPTLLALLPLAAVPIVVHLLYKRRRATIDFPSLWLLRNVELRISPRRKLREILILAARCLFLAALVLAIARPVSRLGAGGLESAVDYLVLIDNSASMQAGSGEGSGFEIARRRAAEVLDALGQKDRAALLPLVEPDGWDAGALSTDRAAVRRALEALECTDATADLAAALERAQALAADATAPRREILLLSDFRGPGLREVSDTERPSRTGLVLVDCATELRQPNVAVELLGVDPPAPLVGRPVEVSVRLVNGGDTELVCSAGLELAEVPLETANVTVPGSGSVVARLRIPRAQRVGWTHGRVTLPADGLPADDTVSFALKVRERLAVLVADPALDAPAPDPEASGRFLARLLDPTGDGTASGIATTRLRPRDVRDRLSDDVSAVLVCGYASLARAGADALRDFAAGGGLVLVFPEPDDGPGDAGRDWLGAVPAGAVETVDPAGSVRFVEVERAVDLRDLTVRMRCALATHPDATVLLSFDGDRPALAVAPVEDGFAAGAGFALSPDWGKFTFHPQIVALVHRLVARHARAPRIVSATAGSVLRLPADGVAQVTRDGEPLGEFRAADGFLDLGRVLRAGIYALEVAGDGQRFVAVRPAARESLLARPAPELIAARFGEAALLGEEVDLAAYLLERRVGRDYAPWLLVAALAFALLEALLANRWHPEKKSARRVRPARAEAVA